MVWARHPECFRSNPETKDYRRDMVEKFEALIADKKYPWKLSEILPKVLVAGEHAGVLSEEGAKLLDVSGNLEAGIPLCPSEGDAGTGMVATNSVAKRTGNVSAGTSVFAMIVLEKELSNVYPEIDMVTTPTGNLVAMVHANNCTSDLNAWVGIFREFAEAFGVKVDMTNCSALCTGKLWAKIPDCGGLLSYGYFSGENITHMEEGRPLFVRTPKSNFNLANFIESPSVYRAGRSESMAWTFCSKKKMCRRTRSSDMAVCLRPKGSDRRSWQRR